MSGASGLLTQGGVPEVQVANTPNVASAGRQTPTTLLDVTYTGKTANFNEAAILDCTNYQFVQILVLETQAWTGTTPQLQVDLVAYSDDLAESVDYYNNGAHGGSFLLSIGPGCSANHLVPKHLSFGYVITGTTPNVSFRIIVEAW